MNNEKCHGGWVAYHNTRVCGKECNTCITNRGFENLEYIYIYMCEFYFFTKLCYSYPPGCK